MQSWDNLVTCNLRKLHNNITFQVKSNITKLLFSLAIINYNILLSEEKYIILLLGQIFFIKVLFLSKKCSKFMFIGKF